MMPVLEELQLVSVHHDNITKVNEVHLDLRGADDLVNHHPVEPHSLR